MIAEFYNGEPAHVSERLSMFKSLNRSVGHLGELDSICQCRRRLCLLNTAGDVEYASGMAECREAVSCLF